MPTVSAPPRPELDVERNVATGGTLFGNPLSAAAAIAALTEVLVPGPTSTRPRWAGLADGIDAALRDAGLPWTTTASVPAPASGTGPDPRTGADAHAMIDLELTRLLRIWMANRGIWEALPGAGPTVPVPAGFAEVDRYLTATPSCWSR